MSLWTGRLEFHLWRGVGKHRDLYLLSLQLGYCGLSLQPSMWWRQFQMPYTLTRAESDFFSPYFFSACADKGFCFSCIGVGFCLFVCLVFLPLQIFNFFFFLLLRMPQIAAFPAINPYRKWRWTIKGKLFGVSLWCYNYSPSSSLCSIQV